LQAAAASSIPSSKMSCLCGTYGNNDATRADLMDEATDLPVCDYDKNPTPLYRNLEQHQWGAVSRFLKTGVWPGDFFSDKLTPKEQVRTWIHRYDDTHHEVHDNDQLLASRADGDDSTYHSMMIIKQNTTKTSFAGPASIMTPELKRRLRWRQLPLHAALIFMAPPVIIKQLIQAFPYALRCPDDKGMLPLHLAFRQAVPDDVLTILLRLFPNGMHVRDQKGRLPVECVRMDLVEEVKGITGASATVPVRGMIIQSIMQQSKEKFSKQQQDTIQAFRKDIGELQDKMDKLERSLKSMDAREKSTRDELENTLEELSGLRRNHRKLQEMQHISMEKQQEQEASVIQSMSFQQRIMEQLEMGDDVPEQAPTPRSRGRGNSRGRSRSRNGSRGNLLLDPVTTPSSTSRHHNSSSLEEEDDTGSASSFSEYPATSKSNLRSARTAASAFSGRTGVIGAPSILTKTSSRYHQADAETDFETDFETDQVDTDAEQNEAITRRRYRSAAIKRANDEDDNMPMFPYPNILNRNEPQQSSRQPISSSLRRKSLSSPRQAATFIATNPRKHPQRGSIARAVYPSKSPKAGRAISAKSLFHNDSPTSQATTTAAGGGGSGGGGRVDDSAVTTSKLATSGGNHCGTSTGNWDFTFSPGFLQPVLSSAKE